MKDYKIIVDAVSINEGIVIEINSMNLNERIKLPPLGSGWFYQIYAEDREVD